MSGSAYLDISSERPKFLNVAIIIRVVFACSAPITFGVPLGSKANAENPLPQFARLVQI